MTTYLKFLSLDHKGRHSGTVLPIGEWIDIEGPLELYKNGVHVTAPEHAPIWFDEACHPVELRGEFVVGDAKLCCRSVKIHPAYPAWTRETVVSFAADCAERVLPLFEAASPNDQRPRQAIEAARSGGKAEAAAWAARAAGAAEAAWAARASAGAARAALAAAWAAETDMREWRGRLLMWYLNGRQGEKP